MSELILDVGVKTDPVEYRYSFSWLFRLMCSQSIRYLQLGTFFELYHLPDTYFIQLKREAEDFNVDILSLFTAHRELGGFFRKEECFHHVARRNYERLIEIGALVGAESVGSNPGAILRDELDLKEQGIEYFISQLKELMHYAFQCGVPILTVEPMSCSAEPPSTPSEIHAMASELEDYHIAHPDHTALVRFCADVSHGYTDKKKLVKWDTYRILNASLPYLHELHLKNTDAQYIDSFGFTKEELNNGIIRGEEVQRFLLDHASALPTKHLIGYLELPGPKLGRDSTDEMLESQLRESIGYLKKTFAHYPPESKQHRVRRSHLQLGSQKKMKSPVQISASIMCADLSNAENCTRELDILGVDFVHFDIMDAHFTPNLPLGLELLKQLRAKTRLPFDVHLMVEDNEFFVEALHESGVDQISVHLESARHLDRILTQIHNYGMKAGVALNPSTPIEGLKYVLELLDFVVVMTVNPGYAGQKLVTTAIEKIADCRQFLQQSARHVLIEVDGNVSFKNVPHMVGNGADILVTGTSSLFNPTVSLAQNMQHLRRVVEDGVKMRGDTPTTKVGGR